MKRIAWVAAAAAGTLAVTPAFAQTDSNSQSNDKAGKSPLSTERSRSSSENAPPSYQVGKPGDPAVQRDRAQQGLSQQGTGYSGDHTSDTARSGTGTSGTTGSSAATTGSTAAGSTAAEASGSHAELMQRLHAGNEAEIQAGQWMEQHAQNGKVKDFAKKMVKDHQSLDKDLQKFAKKAGVSLTGGPSSDPTAAQDEKHMQAMKDLPAGQVDRHYMTMMVNDHQRDVSEVRSAADQAKNGNDKDFAKLLDKTAKKMEDHLKDAQKIQRDLGSRQARTPSSQ